ncbi:hypothetical protein KUCAC02_031928, partial [Chaenocephalus aceratus]
GPQEEVSWLGFCSGSNLGLELETKMAAVLFIVAVVAWQKARTISSKGIVGSCVGLFDPYSSTIVEVLPTYPTDEAPAPDIASRRRITYELASNQEHKQQCWRGPPGLESFCSRLFDVEPARLNLSPRPEFSLPIIKHPYWVRSQGCGPNQTRSPLEGGGLRRKKKKRGGRERLSPSLETSNHFGGVGVTAIFHVPGPSSPALSSDGT